MSEDAAPRTLNSDAALEKPINDELGFQEFAESIAGSIHQSIPNEEFIVGISGQWGSGKSTIINFIETELRQKDDTATIVRFNPWWFSDEADLIEKFLSQLSANLEGYEEIDQLREKIATYARAFSKIPFSSFGAPVDKAAEGVADLTETQPPNINELRDDIAAHLTDYDGDIVVIVDDIDRLAPDKIRHMFRVIKTVADFPSLSYLVAFDRDVVTTALEGYRGVSDGEEYLHKIIQLPITVPQPKEGTLHQFLSERLNQILFNSDSVFDEDRWEGAYQDGIRPLIETPRDAIRLSNAVQTTIQGIDSEVNFVDLVCIEAIRLYNPDGYLKIRATEAQFTVQDSNEKISKSYLEPLFEEFDTTQVDAFKTLVSYLFPIIDEIFARTRLKHHDEGHPDYFSRNRICDEKNFSVYFRQSIGEAELTEAVFIEGLNKSHYSNEFVSFLRGQTKYKGVRGRSRAYNFMAELRDRYDECGDKADTLIALLRVGDELAVADPPHNRLDSGAEEFVVQTAGRLLASEARERRFDLVTSTLEQVEAPYVMVDLISRLDQGELFDEDAIEDEDRLFEASEIREIKQLACDRILETARDGTMFESPHLHEIFDAWVAWDLGYRYESWSRQNLNTADEIFRVLDGLVETGQIYKTGKSDAKEYLDPQWLEPLLSPEAAMDQIIANGRLSGRKQDLYSLLQKGISIRDSGNDPTSLQQWEY